MKTTLFFKNLFFMFIVILIITGCTNKKNIPPPIIKIKKICPEMVILKPLKNNIKPVKINFKKINNEYIKIKLSDLEKSSKNSQRKSIIINKQKKYINFYEAQIKEIRKTCKGKK